MTSYILFDDQTENAESQQVNLNGKYSFQILGNLGGGTVTIFKDEQAMMDGAFTAVTDKVIETNGQIHVELSGSSGAECTVTIKKITG